MQFGIGLLGAGWTIEGAAARLLAGDTPPSPNFHLHAAKYAGKIAKETVLSDYPSLPDLTNEGIVRRCAGCSRPVRMSEARLVRDAFMIEYGVHLEYAA